MRTTEVYCNECKQTHLREIWCCDRCGFWTNPVFPHGLYCTKLKRFVMNSNKAIPEDCPLPKSEKPTTPYRFSTDYELLYETICSGQEIVAFVDNDNFTHPLDESKGPSRDVCVVKRREAYRIVASARGIVYFAVYPFDKADGLEEKEVFTRLCYEHNLEWIPSQIVADQVKIK